MKLLYNHSKKFLVSILMFTLILVSNFGLIYSAQSLLKNGVYASEFTVEDSITVTNSSFTSSDTSSSYPREAKDFTFSSQDSSTSVKHGIISINETTYKNNYINYGLGKNDNPETASESYDDYILMINSDGVNSSCGYTSKEFSFNSSGHYYVSVNVYTANIDSSATLYLFNGDKVFATIPNINTAGNWKKYYFFVSTNNYETLDLSLGMWLGSKETSVNSSVFFDQVSAGEISLSTISTLMHGSNVDGVGSHLNDAKNIYYANLDGENQITTIPMNSENIIFNASESDNAGDDAYTFYGFIQYIDSIGKARNTIKVTNHKANKITFDSTSFRLGANKVYKISVKVKANLDAGNAFMKLIEDIEEDAKSSDSLSISTTSNKFDEGFVEYSIIVNSDPTKDRDFKLSFGLNSDAVGEVYFSEILISSVPYTTYENASSNDKTLDLSSDYTGSKTITNYNFNLSTANDISSFNEVKINDASSWTINKSSNGYTQVAGVFNVKDYNKLNKTDLLGIANPGFITSINSTTNNVLMLHNQMSDYLSATSTSFNLSRNSYYKVSVWVQTQISSSSSGAMISVKDTANNIELAKIDNLNTKGEGNVNVWKQYALYIKTGYQDVEASLLLGLGEKENAVSGYAFFDQCLVDTIEESDYNAIIAGDTEVKADLSDPMTSEIFFAGTSSTNSTSTRADLINIEDEDELSKYLVSADYGSAKSLQASNKNVLAIHSTLADDYYVFDTKLNYSLTSGSFYKISIDVYTAYLATNQEDVTACAQFSLASLADGAFSDIISDKTWTTYTFYIRPDSDVTTQVALSLGTSDILCHGTVLFANLNFEELDIEETEFNNLVKDLPATSKVVGEVLTEDEETETTENKDDNDINWALITSSLTAVAVLIAVIGVAFKKVFKPSKKRIKKSKVEYDRNNSVLRQKYRKLAYSKREKDIRSLEKQLEVLNQDKLDKEDKYKQLLSKVRELKLANRDGSLNAELVNLDKDMKKASKNVSKVGVSVNRIKERISYMKTEGYLLDLEKRLAKQDELAKAKGSSIEEVLKNEDINIDAEQDRILDNAIQRADEIIEKKKEEARIADEKAEQERTEQKD